jgi:hypothetical protein
MPIDLAAQEGEIARSILYAFTEKVENKLYEQMMDDLKPKLKAAAKAAVQEMEPKIRSFVEHHNYRLIVEIVLKGVDFSGAETTAGNR